MSFWDSQRFPALPKPRNFLPRRSMRMFLCNGDVVPRDNKEILKIGWSGGMTAVSNKKLVTYASCLKIYMLKQKLFQKQINLQSLYQGIIRNPCWFDDEDAWGGYSLKKNSCEESSWTSPEWLLHCLSHHPPRLWEVLWPILLLESCDFCCDFDLPKVGNTNPPWGHIGMVSL